MTQVSPYGIDVVNLSAADIRKRLAPYRISCKKTAAWQLISTLILFSAGIGGMWAAFINDMYWLSLILAVPTSAMIVRLFIIQHDCGHGSFLKSQNANHVIGSLLSVFTLTPYYDWRHRHALHHATHGDLDNRGDGDVMTHTVDEYAAFTPRQKLGYQIYRHPITIFLFFPTLLFLVRFRWPDGDGGNRRNRQFSVWFINVCLIALTLSLGFVIGFKEFFMLYIPMMISAATIGVWMFFVQHQFDPNYWQRHDAWDRVHSCLKGSSYYKLPKVLQWATGNIGLHHIHHLDSRIPNYRLQKCLDENEDLLSVPPLTIWASLHCPSLKLWDEDGERMVTFKEAKQIIAEKAKQASSPTDPAPKPTRSPSASAA